MEKDGLPATIERYLFQILVGLVGVSLSLNSYFVKDKIQEISENIAKMTSSIHGLEVSTAVVKQQLDFQAKQIAVLEADVDRLKRGASLRPK